MTPANYISPNTTVYVKVTTANGCFDFAKITLTITPPKPSPLLTDQYICPEARITLNAGPGYTSYLWSTGATTPSITVSIGNYWVILKSDGCETKQLVKVMSVPIPKIKKINVTNNTATIIVEDGTSPYQYSKDGMIWQDSNVFTNLTRGKNVFYVKDASNCNPVEAQILVPNLVNAITPNSDGINDTLDYSELTFLKDLKFGIFNRYGQLIYSSEKNNNYRWDGTIGGSPVSSDTYWYEIRWTDPDTQKLVTYTGWILVKNRN
jgi:gliding motility-associated-like protein